MYGELSIVLAIALVFALLRLSLNSTPAGYFGPAVRKVDDVFGLGVKKLR